MPADPYASILPFVGWANAFTAAELDTIEAYGDSLAQHKSVVSDLYGPDADIQRVSRTAWMEQAPEIDWLYHRIWQTVRRLNEQVYQFDLTGFSEPFQYAVYRADERAHFDWHMDQGRLPVQRKLSFTLQLSDPSQYEGGDLQFNVRRQVDVAPKQRGVLIAFPSYTLHRVTPVTAGVRKSLVIWTTGPKFR